MIESERECVTWIEPLIRYVQNCPFRSHRVKSIQKLNVSGECNAMNLFSSKLSYYAKRMFLPSNNGFVRRFIPTELQSVTFVTCKPHWNTHKNQMKNHQPRTKAIIPICMRTFGKANIFNTNWQDLCQPYRCQQTVPSHRPIILHPKKLLSTLSTFSYDSFLKMLF